MRNIFLCTNFNESQVAVVNVLQHNRNFLCTNERKAIKGWYHAAYRLPVCMVTHIASVWIHRVRLPILLVVS